MSTSGPDDEAPWWVKADDCEITDDLIPDKMECANCSVHIPYQTLNDTDPRAELEFWEPTYTKEVDDDEVWVYCSESCLISDMDTKLSS